MTSATPLGDIETAGRPRQPAATPLAWTMFGSWGDTRLFANGRRGMWRISRGGPGDSRWRLTLQADPLTPVEAPCGEFAALHAAQAHAAQEDVR